MTELGGPRRSDRQSTAGGMTAPDMASGEPALPVFMQIRDLEDELLQIKYKPLPRPMAVGGAAFSIVAGLFFVFAGFPESTFEWVGWSVLVTVAVLGLGWGLRWLIGTYAEQMSVTRRLYELKALARANPGGDSPGVSSRTDSVAHPCIEMDNCPMSPPRGDPTKR